MKRTVLLCILSLTFLCSCKTEKDLIVITDRLPIKASFVYLTGSAAPCGWEIVNATKVNPVPGESYIFVYEDVLKKGEFKASTKTGAWTVPFIRPKAEGVSFGKEGLTEDEFIQTAGDYNDWKWTVTETAIYRLTFDLRKWTFKADYVKDYEAPVVPREPINANALYIVGNIVEGAKDWTVVGGTPMTVSEDNQFEFTWEGNLKAEGYMKIATSIDFDVVDGDEGAAWGQQFVRNPSRNVLTFGREGLAKSEVGYEKDDGKYGNSYWQCTAAGKYKIIINLKDWTIVIEPRD